MNPYEPSAAQEAPTPKQSARWKFAAFVFLVIATNLLSAGAGTILGYRAGYHDAGGHQKHISPEP